MAKACSIRSTRSVSGRSQALAFEKKRRSEVNRVAIANRNSNRHGYVSAVLACLLLVLTTLARGQSTTGTLRGQVLDPEGATIANAKISITNQDTGVVVNTAS